MNAASRRKALRLNQQTARLMTAAPQVVAHRLTRMALAGPQPNASDQREFHLMRAEKLAAFGESWQAMGLQMWLRRGVPLDPLEDALEVARANAQRLRRRRSR